jgi:hypothetical protein
MFCNVLPERAGSRVPQVTQYQADPGVRPSLVMSLLPPAGSGQSHLMGPHCHEMKPVSCLR